MQMTQWLKLRMTLQNAPVWFIKKEQNQDIEEVDKKI